MNFILDFLTFTKESPSDFDDRKLPTLDFKIWIENGRIWYQFFQKLMSNNVVIQERSALSEQVKVSSLQEEVVRRLKHTRAELPDKDRIEVLEDLSQRMTNSGHKPAFTRRVLISGIAKYERKVEQSKLDPGDRNYKHLHQPSGRSGSRLKRKAMAQDNWFKMNKDKENTGGGQMMKNFQKDGKQVKTKKLQPSTVMFVPNTRRGTLVKKMKMNEDRLAEMTGFKVNYVEAAGTKLGRVFSLDLSKNQPCGRNMEKCRSCNSPGETVENCRARCVTYESRCILCNPEKQRVSNPLEEKVQPEQPRDGIYIGESSRSIAERTNEHFNDAESFAKKSHVIKHWIKSHPELNTAPPFKVKKLRQYKDCLSRQVGEAIAILLSRDNLLKSKNEYIKNCIYLE